MYNNGEKAAATRISPNPREPSIGYSRKINAEGIIIYKSLNPYMCIKYNPIRAPAENNKNEIRKAVLILI